MCVGGVCVCGCVCVWVGVGEWMCVGGVCGWVCVCVRGCGGSRWVRWVGVGGVRCTLIPIIHAAYKKLNSRLLLTAITKYFVQCIDGDMYIHNFAFFPNRLAAQQKTKQKQDMELQRSIVKMIYIPMINIY